ncbi:NAD(P)-dependent dehydrogenase (short-subunit alcohol dehydrogenase family) [Paenibacillus phyllosphaerae]|uniref:NAD(P)-dependent dehydrogenase (Short-subunit alcohol dehydrogenase family) n=1 Tax=Paenibacillus phyllosphaerae TaxID=274593 RepID=A0A7W5FLY9_9BACL|nr:SDR family oxidoreductase [Paenibacillus phyllosphaerae]MBB3109691.1 NAD(P)-dependent dehydrogenase (short-subunit alcohol dehydrogenase family) [Paenibacillus phyllosphaerae]
MSSINQQQASSSKERVAFITGTSSGFGMLTAIELAKQQYRVIATMRDPRKAAELLERAERTGVAERIVILALDVTEPLSIARAVSETLDKYGRIDLLVNNAGFAVGGFVEEVAMDDWRRQMETNFFGLVAMTQAVIPVMRKQSSGIIINIGSVSGRIGFPGYAPYAASKFAVEGFSESLRHELGPLGIHVALVEPGAYRTPIWDKGLEQIRSSGNSPYVRRLEAIMRYARRTSETAPDPQQVADLIGRIARARSPRLRYPIGRGSTLALWGKALLPWKWFERVIERGTR